MKDKIFRKLCVLLSAVLCAGCLYAGYKIERGVSDITADSALTAETTAKAVAAISEKITNAEDVDTGAADSDADMNETEDADAAKDTEVEVLSENVETAVDDYVWVNTNANIRSGPGTEFDALGVAAYATKLHRVAVLETGWSKVEWDNGYAYINSELIQTDEIVITETTTTSTSSSGQTSELCIGVAKEIFDATNAERVAAGLSPLIWSDELARAADIRAEEIINTFSHTRPDGTKCYSLSSLICGENIVRGPHATGQEMVDHWMASEGHKENILDPNYTMMGVGTRCTDMGDTGVQLFSWY